jgi:hypothetical protein
MILLRQISSTVLVYKRFNDAINHGRNGEGIEMNGRMMLITGGAGFIGSHSTERLLNEGHKVTVLDNFSNGKIENIQHLLDNPLITLVKEDMKKPKQLGQIVNDSDIIFHLAANPEVKLGETGPKTHFEENILATFNLLAAIRKDGTAKTRFRLLIHCVWRSQTGSNAGRLRAADADLNLRCLKARMRSPHCGLHPYVQSSSNHSAPS